MSHVWSGDDDAPGNLTGYALWLQVHHDGAWRAVCPLGKATSRYLLRWLDMHPACTTLRILAEKTG